MKSQIALFFSDIPLTILGMLIFLIIFIVVMLWTYLRPESKEFYTKIERLPLNGEDGYE